LKTQYFARETDWRGPISRKLCCMLVKRWSYRPWNDGCRRYFTMNELNRMISKV
jgi:hypothetical protein